MFTKYELLDGISELMEGKNTIQNCEKLAAIYTVLDHLYPENAENPQKTALNVQNEGYSYDNKVETESRPVVGRYGNSDFLQAVAGKDTQDVFLLLNELMNATAVLAPRLYDSTMRKLTE